jgi:hypothetical protein
VAAHRNKKSPVIMTRLFGVVEVCLHEADGGCLQSLGALFYGEFHLLAFLKIAKTIALNSGVVNKHIRATLASEEPIAFVSVEPLDRTDYTF